MGLDWREGDEESKRAIGYVNDLRGQQNATIQTSVESLKCSEIVRSCWPRSPIDLEVKSPWSLRDRAHSMWTSQSSCRVAVTRLASDVIAVSDARILCC